MRIAFGKCPKCGPKLLIQQTPNHIGHLFLSLLTGGLWLLVWFYLIVRTWSSIWRCTNCGFDAVKY